MKASQLRDRAIIARLSVSCFIGNPRDKALTSEVEKDHNTEAKRISVRKRIMQGAELNGAIAASQTLRKTFERVSLPWLDGGFRLIPSVNFIAAKQEIDAAIAVFLAASADFIGKRKEIIERDKVALNGTFNANDYPSESELRAKFAATLECSPIPTVNADWRIAGIDAQTAQEIAQSVEAATLARLAEGKKELLANMRQAIAHLAGKLGEEGKRFKEASINNIIEEALRVSSLNVTEDKTLETLASDVADTFKGIDAEAIRDSDGARKEAEALCKETLESIDAAMSGIF
jgi:hypothetical protein